jgi:hypothetical protein
VDERRYAAQISGSGPQPNAYSRITRTPLYIRPQEKLGAGVAGRYHPPSGSMTVSRATVEPGSEWANPIPHESAHVIYDRAGLGEYAGDLLGLIPQQAVDILRSAMEKYPSFSSQDAGVRIRRFVDEGLGYSIGQPWGTAYVNAVAARIRDPKLRARLLRLHANGLGSRGLT